MVASGERKRKQKRIAFITASYLIVDEILQGLEDEERAEESLRRGRLSSAIHDLFYLRMESLDAASFRAMFRMGRSALEILRNRLAPFLAPRVTPNNMEGRMHGNRRVVTIDEKMCIGIRILAGATIPDATWGFGVKRTATKQAFYNFLLAIVQSTIGPIQFPTTVQGLQDLERIMARSGLIRPEFHGCVGAVDGYAVRIKSPMATECQNPGSYRNRKGFCSVNAQAIGTGDLRVRWLSLESPGSTHDHTAFMMTEFAEWWLREHNMCNAFGRFFWLAGDEAYGIHQTLVTPWPGQGLIVVAPYKDGFNYYFSGGSRNPIERIFGVIYARWGILWRPIMFPMKTVPVIFYCICRLHNFLIDVKEGSTPPVGSGFGYFGSRDTPEQRERLRSHRHTTGYDEEPHEQQECALENVAGLIAGRCHIREQITAHLESHGVRRPAESLGRLGPS